MTIPRLRAVFLGTPAFAVPSLRALLTAGEVLAVVTQPDKPKGRGRRTVPPPVAVFARERGLRVLQPAKLRSPEVLETLRELAPDIIVTVAYGKIIPKRSSNSRRADLSTCIRRCCRNTGAPLRFKPFSATDSGRPA